MKDVDVYIPFPNLHLIQNDTSSSATEASPVGRRPGNHYGESQFKDPKLYSLTTKLALLQRAFDNFSAWLTFCAAWSFGQGTKHIWRRWNRA